MHSMRTSSTIGCTALRSDFETCHEFAELCNGLEGARTFFLACFDAPKSELHRQSLRNRTGLAKSETNQIHLVLAYDQHPLCLELQVNILLDAVGH